MTFVFLFDLQLSFLRISHDPEQFTTDNTLQKAIQILVSSREIGVLFRKESRCLLILREKPKKYLRVVTIIANNIHFKISPLMPSCTFLYLLKLYSDERKRVHVWLRSCS